MGEAMKFELTHPLLADPPSYDDRKLTGQCCRASCSNACQDDHLLCESCAEDHRRANRQYDHWKRKQLVLPFIQYVAGGDGEK